MERWPFVRVLSHEQDWVDDQAILGGAFGTGRTVPTPRLPQCAVAVAYCCGSGGVGDVPCGRRVQLRAAVTASLVV